MSAGQIKRSPRRSPEVSGSLAYYSLLAGINIRRTASIQRNLSDNTSQNPILEALLKVRSDTDKA